MTERLKKVFDVSLKIKERDWAARGSRSQTAHNLSINTASRAEHDALQFAGLISDRLEGIPGLEQANSIAASIQVIGKHVQHARHERRAHD